VQVICNAKYRQKAGLPKMVSLISTVSKFLPKKKHKFMR
jgi:hypothetical protein